MSISNKEPKKKLRIAIIGSRGIPAKYGGYETIAQDLGIELVKKGLDVYVTCESHGFRKNPYATYRGVNLVYFPIIESIRNLSDVILYDALSVFWATFNVDVIYMLSYTNIPLLILPKIFQKTLLVNADGIEWKRRKHNSFLRFLLKNFESFSTRIVDSVVVDSHAIGNHFKDNYGVKTLYIPYGIREILPLDSSILIKYNLKPQEYYLIIARLEPENNIDYIINEFKKSGTKKTLVLMAPIKNTSFVRNLLKLKSDKILFVGGIYNPALQRTFRHNCFAYIHGHEVGGTNPSLIEALSCCNIILALDVPFNREVAGDAAFYFTKDSDSLSEKIRFLENKNCDEFVKNRQIAYENYKTKYTVEGMVATSYILFKEAFEYKHSKPKLSETLRRRKSNIFKSFFKYKKLLE